MTLNKAALAVDGARVTSSLVRLGFYVATGGDEGVAAAPDLKITPLDIAGYGFQMAPGGALVLNGYQGADPTQTYVVENVGPHVFGSESMPVVSSSERYFIAAIVVGDPDGDQVGHPFMPSQMAQGTQADFNYVRLVLFPVADSSVTDLGDRGFPLLELARIRIRASSQTIEATDIVDLRDLARPRSKVEQGIVLSGLTGTQTNGLTAESAAPERFPNIGVLTVKCPKWATTVKIQGYIEGLRLAKAGVGWVRPYAFLGSSVVVSPTATDIDEYVPAKQNDRRSYSLGGKLNIPTAWRGKTITFAVQGAAPGTASDNFLVADKATNVGLTVFFEESLI